MYGCYETIKDIQDQGTMATIKHFIANEQEHLRQAWKWVLPNALSPNIDDHTMHEVYAWPFSDAVKTEMLSPGLHWIYVLLQRDNGSNYEFSKWY
ncbi:uncharacterized protein Triagg1_190 [Trichoderma aggressivum f. europaeum]|uniref:beta-glucosidase n=1 Tax=Trichoderma aggressivum f. europaeum TaxID=173218 RepID=A0AAE1ILM7_9HYPO|nr:hypothetical protein Triagg1_190 [Trichoderma aggressivum f. europaeum]